MLYIILINPQANLGFGMLRYSNKYGAGMTLS